MFVRFRQVANRLQANLELTRREGGKVKAEHIATLGSVPVSPSIADRIAFWAKANERIGRLANRIGPDIDNIIGALRTRVPVVTSEEVQAAKDRADRIAHGEIVPGATYPEIMSALRARGWTTRDIQHMHDRGELHRITGRLGVQQKIATEIRGEAMEAADRADRTATRLLLRYFRNMEREAIAAGVASAADDDVELTPEFMLAILEQGRIEEEERSDNESPE
jgi:hypothetical protein